MIQIHLLEAKRAKLFVDQDSLNALYKYFEKGLLTEQNIDSGTYARTVDYYGLHAKEFYKLYSTVVDSLLEMESREQLQPQQTEPSTTVIPDSVRLRTTTPLNWQFGHEQEIGCYWKSTWYWSGAPVGHR